MERTTLICHFAHVWTDAQVKGSNLLVLLALADAAEDDGIVRTTRQHIADRARGNRATDYSAMAMLFKSGELLRYDAEAPDVAICIIRTEKEADKSAPCDEAESEFANDDTESDPEGLSDFATSDEFGEEEDDQPFEDIIEAEARMGRPDVDNAPVVEAVQIAPPPPRRMIPKHLPPGDLGLVLAAPGVEEDTRGLLFCYRREHRAELDTALAGLGRNGAADLTRMITEQRIGAPDLDRVASIQKLMSKRG